MSEGISWAVAISGSSGLSFDNTGAAYRLLPGTGITRQTRRRGLIPAPDIHGAAEVSSVLDEGAYNLVVRCVGGSWSGVEGLVNALYNAVQQRSFNLAVTRGGVTTTWAARAASGWDVPWDAEKSWSNILEATALIPVYPIPS